MLINRYITHASSVCIVFIITCIISNFEHQYVQYSVPACLVPNAMHAIDLIDHPSVSDEKKGN